MDPSAHHPALHPLLASRWSPTLFDEQHRLTRDDVELLLEAARWAPSAGNSQPWAFVVGCRGSDEHRRMVAHLAPSTLRWAPTASTLVLNLAHRYVADSELEYSEFAGYDLGQAVAHMTVQARAMGLFARQFRAFDKDALTAEFTVPPHWEVATMTALGRLPEGESAELGAAALRERRTPEDLVWGEVPRAPRCT